MLRVRGVYRMKNGRYRVLKYGCFIGCYGTIEEANFHAKEAEKERMIK